MDLADKMHEALIRRSVGGPNADKPLEERKVPRASTIASRCARRAYYWLVAAPQEPMDAAGAAAVQMGSELEAGILSDFMEAMGVEPTAEHRGSVSQVKANTGWATGTADLLVWISGKWAVVDSKTANADSFEIKKREGISPEHHTQLSIYVEGLKLTMGDQVSDTYYVVLRNTDPRRSGVVYHVQTGRADAREARRIAEQAIYARDMGDETLAPQAYSPEKWNCQYCPYRKTCWGERAQEKRPYNGRRK